MRIKLFAVLTVIASFFGSVSQSLAQTPQTETSQTQAQTQTSETANPEKQDYTLTGDSLIGVENKRSSEDYTTFFGLTSPDQPTVNTTGNSTGNSTEMKKAPMVLRLDPSDTNIYLLPNNQPIQFQGDTDKLQLQLGSPQ